MSALEKSQDMINRIFLDPTIHNYEKSVIYNGLCNDPVDTIGDLEHGLQVLKEHYKILGLIE
jgi:hypothetical protein